MLLNLLVFRDVGRKFEAISYLKSVFHQVELLRGERLYSMAKLERSSDQEAILGPGGEIQIFQTTCKRHKHCPNSGTDLKVRFTGGRGDASTR